MSNNTLILSEISRPSLHTLRCLVLAFDVTFSNDDFVKLTRLVGTKRAAKIGRAVDKLHARILKARPSRSDKLSEEWYDEFVKEFINYALLLAVDYTDLGIPLKGTVLASVCYESVLIFQRELARNCRHVLGDVINSRALSMELIATWRLLPVITANVNDWSPEMVDDSSVGDGAATH